MSSEFMESEYMEMPQAGPITDEQLWGTDALPAGDRDHTCPVYSLPCPAWDAAGMNCMSKTCVLVWTDVNYFGD